MTKRWLSWFERPLSLTAAAVVGAAGWHLLRNGRTAPPAWQALVHAQKSLAVTLDSIGAGMITTDAQGRISQMNPLAEEVTGWTMREARGRSFWDVWQREGLPAHYREQSIVELVESLGFTGDMAHRVVAISRTGKRTPLEARIAPIFVGPDHTPQKATGLVLVFRDMRSLDQAHLVTQQLAAIVQSSHDAIIGKTLDGRITSWNAGAETLFGYTAQEAIGQPVLMLFPPDRLGEEDHVINQIAHGSIVPPFKTQRMRKDGTMVDVLLTISPIRDMDGRIIGASKIARDITHEIRNERMRLDAIRLEAENRQMEESSRLKSQFLANMSHELRTPLNAIIGFADILRTGQVQPDSPKFQSFVGHIATSGRHLLQLINDVLDLSKVESGQFKFFAEPIGPQQVLEEVLAILGTEASRKQLRLDGRADPALERIEIDVGRLKQVLYNFISNAIKFTPEGGEVRVRFLPEGPDWFRIEVEDTGIGIADKDLPSLFAQFMQLDTGPTKRYEGTGLGLALTRSLVEAQGGSVGVRSSPGVGSVFHAVLPRRPLDTQLPTQADQDPDVSPGLRHVLVIANGADERTSLSRSLALAGFEVEQARSGQQALEKTRRRSFSALTLDLLLPDCKGLAVLDQIRGNGLNSDAPVVALTMKGTSEAALASFPVTDVLRKPLREEELRTAFGRVGLQPQAGATPSTIMVIDDHESALTLMSETLQGWGWQVAGFREGRTALQALDEVMPRAIVLDLMMPDMDGFAVLAALQEKPAWRRVPVFVWTCAELSAQDYARLGRSAQAASKRPIQEGSLAEALKHCVSPVESRSVIEPV
ncbi:MAG: PAS domain S-box protein [Acidobacteriota bacterium]